MDEVQEAGREALELIRTPCLAGTGAVVKGNIAEAMVRAGQVSRAESMLGPPEAAGTTLSDFQLGTWVRIDVCQDRLADARRAVADLDEMVSSMPQLTAMRAEVAAQLELWSNRPERAFGRLRTALEELLMTSETEYLGPVYALAARAAADVSRGDRAADALAVLEDLRSRATKDPFGGVCGDSAAWAASWDVEIARLTGAETLDLWVRAAGEWDRITRPHDAAYCRWRGAQVALRDGQGTVAARLLKRAAADTREHVPLNRAIAATAVGLR